MQILDTCLLVGECWEWQGPLTPQGYPRTSWAENKCQSGHVTAARYFGIYEEGKHVLHRCNNRKCLNPEHLYAGTASDNMRDRVMAGAQNTSHLTPEDVLDIRSRYNKEPRADTAARYQLAVSTVKKIQLRYTWKWL